MLFFNILMCFFFVPYEVNTLGEYEPKGTEVENLIFEDNISQTELVCNNHPLVNI